MVGSCALKSSEKFKLLRRRSRRGAHFSPKNAHPLELLVRDADDPNFTVRGNASFDPLYVDSRIVVT